MERYFKVSAVERNKAGEGICVRFGTYPDGRSFVCDMKDELFHPHSVRLMMTRDEVWTAFEYARSPRYEEIAVEWILVEKLEPNTPGNVVQLRPSFSLEHGSFTETEFVAYCNQEGIA